MSDITFPFGKYRGQTVEQVAERDLPYLEWAAGTDIPEKHPELGAAIRAALATGNAVEVELTPIELPELCVEVRGGGRMHDGAWIRAVNDQLFTERTVIAEDNTSRSGKSGTFTVATPDTDGLYLLTENTGSIANQETTNRYVVRRDGEWFALTPNTRNGAAAYLRQQQ